MFFFVCLRPENRQRPLLTIINSVLWLSLKMSLYMFWALSIKTDVLFTIKIISRVVMRTVLLLLFTGMVSNASLAEVPNTFVAGEVATAAKFNENFTFLSEQIESISSGSTDALLGNNSFDGFVLAKVNDVDMKVSSTRLGEYSIVTPTGKTIKVDAEGYPYSTQLIYETSDCSGQAYLPYYHFDQLTDKPAGHIFSNPKISTEISLVSLDESIGYSLNDTLIKVNYRSIDYGSQCSPSTGIRIASKVLPNDSTITGISSIPLIISGIGSELKVSSTEVGTAVTGVFSVYANGVKIGSTTRYPDSVSDYVSVQLDGFNQATISLFKDGSYSGGIVSSGVLYYRLPDCSGDAYYLLANDADKKWWDTTRSTKSIITNNGDYYNLSSQAYSVSQAFGSNRNTGGFCHNSTTDGSNNAYKHATLTSSPVIPTFLPPIVIQGYLEPTPYNSLPVAF